MAKHDPKQDFLDALRHPLARPAPRHGRKGRRAASPVAPQGRPFSVMAFTVAGGSVVVIDALVDPARLEHLELGA
jgi:RNA polymerase sigma-70 factor (ECF subfamily)